MILFRWLPYALECGKKNFFRTESRIIGGREVFENEFPWMAGIISVNKSLLICGATIINDRYVVTAAHCLPYGYVYIRINFFYMFNKSVALRLANGWNKFTFCSFDKNDLKVSVGSHNSCGWDATTTIFSVEEIFPHPSYDKQTNFADIMLVKLVMKITFNQFVRPICLPKSGNHCNLSYKYVSFMTNVTKKTNIRNCSW